ncbi:ROK family protein [Pseudoroseicyclus sp. CXY001]|uniref:ROK family protein n=1 Tax=Pseudoroseicyclus sp. CXY001 TaxID=3242492 RepID=UPI003570E3BD
MTAAGIDIGGTKIETQIFGASWERLETARTGTPATYEALVAAIAAQVRWAMERLPEGAPIGVGAAGLINPATGLALAANLPVTGKPFPADVAAAAGRSVTFVNDCRAFALSEAVFGAAKGRSPAVGLILGTGVGGGVVVGGRLVQGLSAVGGEFGHAYAPAHLVVEHGLPIRRCGCGRTGCFETYVAGPGLARLAETLTGRPMTPPELVEARSSDPAAAKVWDIWCQITAEMLMTLICMVDPAVIVLGGGLSQIPGLTDDLTAALGRAQLSGFSIPELVLAEGGEASGARGAAYAAATAGEAPHG